MFLNFGPSQAPSQAPRSYKKERSRCFVRHVTQPTCHVRMATKETENELKK